MNKYSFIIIHGLHGSGPDHWQSWLFHELKQRNFHVAYPTFSRSHFPDKEVWLAELSDSIENLPKDHKKIVITHSLGGLLWQHFSARQDRRIADHAILVAPPSPKVVIPAAKTFFPVPLSKINLARTAGDTLFVHSTNDPYCSMEDAHAYVKLDFPTVTLDNMGHINTDSGHGKWPWILDLCMNIVNHAPVLSN